MRTAVDGLAAFFALGLAVLALGLAAAVFFAAGVFFVVDVLAAVFFGAAFLVVVVVDAGAPVDAAAFGLASLFSFYIVVNNSRGAKRQFGNTNLWCSFGSSGLGFFLRELNGTGRA